MVLRSLLALALLLPVMAGPALAEDRRGHERARAAFEAGQIRPLAELLAEVERRFRGRVIEADLDRDYGQWYYEFTLLPPNGRVFRVELDATTGQVIRTFGPVQERSAEPALPRPAAPGFTERR